MQREMGLYPGFVAFTGDGKLMAVEMAPGLIHLKEISSGRTVAQLEDPDRNVSTWMSFTPDGHTLQPTALVHEAWLKLVDSPAQSWQNRAHLFAAAAEAMRRLLIARARRKHTQRRGAGAAHLDVDELEIASPIPHERLLAL